MDRDSVNNVRLVERTKSIPAKAGIKFGFRYMIVGAPLESKVTLKTALTNLGNWCVACGRCNYGWATRNLQNKVLRWSLNNDGRQTEFAL